MVSSLHTEVVFSDLAHLPAQLPARFVVVSDTNVGQIYRQSLPDAEWVLFPAGESHKNAETYLETVRQVGAVGADRKTTLVAFGGGVVGDLAGFVAATYLRGIDLIQVPTTLLAQVDSAIGGKVGVDFGGKNLLGAFKRAEKVIVCPEVLSTLPAEEFRSGMAEVLKYGLIMDVDLWHSLQSPFGVQDPRMQPVIQRCIDHKQEIVRIDPYELGEERAILNFGHTIGHALEVEHQYTKRHGEMIAVGMVVEAVLGNLLGMAAPVEEIRETLHRWGLPVFDPLLQEPDRLFAHMRKDKKASEGQLAFSLLDGLGSCRLVRNVDRKIVEEALRIVCAA